MLSPRKQSLLAVLTDMQQHEQGNHGWALFHECLSTVARAGTGAGLDDVLDSMWRLRPHISDTHAITLLGIAVRKLALQDGELASVFDGAVPSSWRATVLSRALTERAPDVTALMETQSNSYTGARRFLLPQLVLGAFAAAHGVFEVRALDLGTSIGLLPRQLNNKVIYDRFAEDLRWTPSAPPFSPIPLVYIGGVDRPPLPTLDWVRACHGPTDYYERRFAEVRWSLEQAEAAGAHVVLEPLDILDPKALDAYLRRRRINVATCNFVLYQYSEDLRRQVVETVVGALEAPGMLLSMEPSHGLTRQGCTVYGYLSGSSRPLHIADVSDAHFMGTVTVHDGLAHLFGRDGTQ